MRIKQKKNVRKRRGGREVGEWPYMEKGRAHNS
jgi:hypothetical protein